MLFVAKDSDGYFGVWKSAKYEFERIDEFSRGKRGF